MKKRLCAFFILIMMLVMPLNALAASISIKFPIKIGFLYVGQSVTLKPTLKGVRLSKVKWTTSSSATASFKANKLTANAEGLCTIRASSGKANASCGVVVLPKKIVLKTGNTHKLPSSSMLRYTSSDPSVAAVDEFGTITGLSEGMADITVSYSGLSLTSKVSVSGESTAILPEQSRAALLDCANSTDQIVLVEYTGKSNATITFHEKKNGVWKQVAQTNGYVGKNGIGKTKEGDKKTPTGTYNLTTAFGIKDDPGATIPYTKVTKYHYWCGSSSSEYYNRFIDTRVIHRKRTSADEYLISYKGVYNYCLFIDYNKEGTPKKGSCIFLHCTGSNNYTAGCIAIPEKMMKQTIKWVHDGAKIVIQEA